MNKNQLYRLPGRFEPEIHDSLVNLYLYAKNCCYRNYQRDSNSKSL